MSESALEMGCFCRTRLKAQKIATMAKMIKRIVSMALRVAVAAEQRDKQGRDQEVHQGAGKQECPCEMHQLVVAEAWQCPAHPNEDKDQHAHFGDEPEKRQQNGRENRYEV